MSFGEALTRAEAALTETEGLEAALSELKASRPSEVKAAEFRRLFHVCYRVLGLNGPPPALSADWPGERIRRKAAELITTSFFDEGARHRAHVQHAITRAVALGREMPAGAPAEPVPVPHVPLDSDEARALARPWLDHLAAAFGDRPLAHLSFCWTAHEFPLAPFAQIIDAWLAEVAPADHAALHRAFALSTLAEQGSQRLTWENCVAEVLPQLEDPHPLVAGAAGVYFGTLYAFELFTRSTPKPLPWALDHISAVKGHRRIVAGGFLQGIDADMGGPFDMLQKELPRFDVQGWVLEVLSKGDEEPYLPSAQSFWFYVHEGFCHAPAFITRMIDAGHGWEAMMCATEMQARVEGMAPVLERLAAMEDPEVNGPAQRTLKAHYSH
ncbi:hypothetical protein [Oceanicola sp. 502str15]|uniref:hypothetical protein n=1 Tax=Oceanicola sp. 502str15 TaxID=2696061 RepID=UPI00209489B6|nr:hypothetical protein [Oceanicola sp. 502str15]MCO6384017.1 hypothetical protein [Oceanicola sp. 502str15]